MDPFSDFGIDLGSTSGLREHAKKKKKPAAAPVNSGGAGDGGEEKKDDAAGDGNNGGAGGGTGGGDAGAGGSGDGSGGDDKKDAGGDNLDDEWATFTATKPKKGAKAAGGGLLGGLPAIPTSDFGTDSFQEIKLGDDAAGKFDLGLGTADTKGGGLGSWGSKWNSGGGSTWDWSSGKAGGEEAAPAAEGAIGEANGEDNPWSMNRPKPTKKKTAKTNFSFGSFDEPSDPPADEPKADDGWGFVSSKDKKKTSIWGAAEPDKKDDAQEKTGAGADSWGWGNAKKKEEPAPSNDDWFTPASKKDKDKDKKKKGSAMLLDDTIEEPSTDKKEDDMWGTWGSKKDKTATLLDDFGTSSTLLSLNPSAILLVS